MKFPSNITPLEPAERGVCQICEGRYKIKHTETVRAACELVAVDTTTNLKTGRCCLPELAFADQMLSYHGRRAGIIHPRPEEPSR